MVRLEGLMADFSLQLANFNSTMVRLEVLNALAIVQIGYKDFNSTMVRLEALTATHMMYRLDFNSTMVRLEDKLMVLLACRVHSISIPLWYD